MNTYTLYFDPSTLSDLQEFSKEYVRWKSNSIATDDDDSGAYVGKELVDIGKVIAFIKKELGISFSIVGAVATMYKLAELGVDIGELEIHNCILGMAFSLA